MMSYKEVMKIDCWIVTANVQVLPKAGYFIMSSPELKINRITNAEKLFIDTAKQVKPEPMLIER